jgi:phosphotransferase system  glucose/maltose/N-acetylglucosamine-specific IIC component
VDDRERIEQLERENAELRAQVPAAADVARRRKISRLMMAGGLAALLTGVVSPSWYAVICGIGWLFGGAAVASTVPAMGK